MVTLVISSTRLYRSLANFSAPVDSYDILPFNYFFALTVVCQRSAQLDLEISDNHLKTTRSIRNSRRGGPFVHVVSSNRLEVTVHRDYEEHPMPETNQFSYPSSDAQLADKPHRIISFDGNTNSTMEDRPEK